MSKSQKVVFNGFDLSCQIFRSISFRSLCSDQIPRSDHWFEKSDLDQIESDLDQWSDLFQIRSPILCQPWRNCIDFVIKFTITILKRFLVNNNLDPFEIFLWNTLIVLPFCKFQLYFAVNDVGNFKHNRQSTEIELNLCPDAQILWYVRLIRKLVWRE